MKREAIIHIHGHEELPKGSFLDRTKEGLIHYQSVAQVEELSKGQTDAPSFDASTLSVKLHSGGTKEVDLYEVFWFDLSPKLTAENVMRQILGGSKLIGFWFEKSLKEIRKQYPWMARGIYISILILLLWYFWIVLAFLELITSVAVFDGIKAGISNLLPGELLAFLNFFFSWQLWLGIAFVFSWVSRKMTQVVDITNFGKAFLVDEKLRLQIRKRVSDMVYGTLQSNQYDQVTLLAHSFGCAIVADFLAEFTTNKEVKVRVVTMGGPIALLTIRSPWMKEELRKAQANPNISTWDDYFSKDDFLCTATPNEAELPNFSEHEMTDPMSRFANKIGSNHTSYHEKEFINNSLLS